MQILPGRESAAIKLIEANDLVTIYYYYCFFFFLMQISYEDLPHLGPDHKKTFSCRVLVGERSFKEGSGATKILAKKNAALHALEGLFNMRVELGMWQSFPS